VSVTLLRGSTEHSGEWRRRAPDRSQARVLILPSLQAQKSVRMFGLSGEERLHIVLQARYIVPGTMREERLHSQRAQGTGTRSPCEERETRSFSSRLQARKQSERLPSLA
jgi:hypothetical protein